MKKRSRKTTVAGEAAVIILCLAAAGCSGKKGAEDAVAETPDVSEIEAPAGYARMTPNNAFEGSTWFVADVSSEEGSQNFTGATVVLPSGKPAMHLVDSLCNNRRCGVVLKIDEYLASTAQPIPRPIDADSVQLKVVGPTETWEATLTIFPLEVSRGSGSSAVLRLFGSYLLSSFSLTNGASMIPNFANPSDLAKNARLYVTGPITIEGTIDFGGLPGTAALGGLGGSSAGAGGKPGAAPEKGSGRGGGGAGAGGGAGGGGGHAGVGDEGEAGTGTGGARGLDYGEEGMECLRGDTVLCGGSGGGAAADAGGGGGGGAILIVSLDSITFKDAVIASNGGDGGPGTAGGGAGSGGGIVLVAPRFQGSVRVSAEGGEGGTGSGGADGGYGGAGRVVFEGDTGGATITASPPSYYVGPSVDKAALTLLEPDAATDVAGFCNAGAQVSVNNISLEEGGLVTAECSGEGRFSVQMGLVPGVNELVVFQAREEGGFVYGQVGNTFDIAGTLVRGSRLIIVHVPAAE